MGRPCYAGGVLRYVRALWPLWFVVLAIYGGVIGGFLFAFARILITGR